MAEKDSIAMENVVKKFILPGADSEAIYSILEQECDADEKQRLLTAHIEGLPKGRIVPQMLEGLGISELLAKTDEGPVHARELAAYAHTSTFGVEDMLNGNFPGDCHVNNIPRRYVTFGDNPVEVEGVNVGGFDVSLKHTRHNACTVAKREHVDNSWKHEQYYMVSRDFNQEISQIKMKYEVSKNGCSSDMVKIEFENFDSSECNCKGSYLTWLKGGKPVKVSFGYSGNINSIELLNVASGGVTSIDIGAVTKDPNKMLADYKSNSKLEGAITVDTADDMISKIQYANTLANYKSIVELMAETAGLELGKNEWVHFRIDITGTLEGMASSFRGPLVLEDHPSSQIVKYTTEKI